MNTESEQYTVALAHTRTTGEVLQAVDSSLHGLSQAEADKRIELCGENRLPCTSPPGVLQIFARQFASPLIYVLLCAAILSIFIQEWSDAGFITAVLLINAVIGSIQEYSAQRAAAALDRMVTSRCHVLREGDSYEIDSERLVPGDIIVLQSGDRVPADIRLLSCHDLEIDESTLTGESLPVNKDAQLQLPPDTFLGDRKNMVFAGTLVNRGRGRGVVVATALNTELGHIAADVLMKPVARPPLLVRMEIFTQRVAIVVAVAAIIMAAISFSRGMPLAEIFMLAVALAVSVIPEGLPVALTVALAIGMRRMAQRHVIIRRLMAVEALGSCTFIATDKTGTLTVNQLTVRRIVLPAQPAWTVTGEGMEVEGVVQTEQGMLSTGEQALLNRLCLAAVLPNDAFIGHRGHGWTHHGDAVDVALLVMAHKVAVVRDEAVNRYPELATIPFESERLFAASLNQQGSSSVVFIKGAMEQLLPMCQLMATIEGDVTLEPALIEQQAIDLAAEGYRVLGMASGSIQLNEGEVFSEEHLHGLCFLGLVGMIDPLRNEAVDAITRCRQAGIEVAMITGDHPATASAIAVELGLDNPYQPVTGPVLKRALADNSIDRLTREARVFARVEPHQKLDIVQSLQRHGHFVAVSGDGANDAPALRAAQVGVAMGKSGTDVARETASLIIADDNFSSIVAGVEEGRIAYANVRKVIFLLISTGAAELVLFILALITGQPLPLLAVQLLWLNLVTNGIQDVALAFEPGEGDELQRPPRSPTEPIFNRLMIERVVISALVIGVLAFVLFQWLLSLGYALDEARNGTLLLMVLFENIHVFNSRSETRSVFFHRLLANPILLMGTLAAQLIHVAAMYTPWISDVLAIQPVSLAEWLQLLCLALSILLVMECHKWLWNRRQV
ncbi:MAG: HAD-IC family P-type ATPase [Gammaproteobacteria bacterium]|nr:HAD-IC family P-type ATPase [Gammaproteobacteria bacterium]